MSVQPNQSAIIEFVQDFRLRVFSIANTGSQKSAGIKAYKKQLPK
jgi:hypothetical protein